MKNKSKNSGRKILAFGAHPDDVEFGAGALIIKEIKNGAKVKIIICSLGEAGTNGTPEGRKREAQAAAKFMGAEIEFLHFGGDGHIENSPENGIMAAEAIRKFKPHIVLAPSLTKNQHPDHTHMAEIARTACRYSRYGGLKEIKKYAVHAINALYYYPSSAEIDAPPDIMIDISREYADWVKAMKLHKSQMKTKSYINLQTSKARYFGSSIGVEYAAGLWANDPIRIENISDINDSPRNY